MERHVEWNMEETSTSVEQAGKMLSVVVAGITERLQDLVAHHPDAVVSVFLKIALIAHSPEGTSA